MKTFSQHLADLKATRTAKAAAQQEIAQKAIEQGRSMDTAEAQAFDDHTAEIKSLDADITRISVLADNDAKSAAPVTNGAAESQTVAPGTSVAKAAVTVKNTEKTDAGIGFARFARVKALSKLESLPQLQIAQALYPHDEKLHLHIQGKAAVPAANTLNQQWGANLITDGGAAFADFVEYLRPRSLLGRISGSLRNLPFDTPVLVQGSAGAAAWVGEGKSKPLTQWTYTQARLTPLKVAAIAAATQEMLKRSTPSVDALIRDELARAVGARIDTTFMSDAAAVSNVSPAGILNGVSPLTLSGDSSSEGVRCDLQAFLIAMSEAQESLAGSFWVMPERVAIALSLMQNPLGQSAFPGVTFEGGTLLGLPVYVTGYADTTSAGSAVALIKGDEIFLGDEGGIDVAISDQASLVMDDAPAQSSVPTVAATTVVSMFQTNTVAFRVERFLNWQKRRAASVVWGRVGWDAC